MPTTYLTDAEIERIGRRIADRTLPKPEWTHAAHFACALWVLTQPELDAAADMPRMIRGYNAFTGTPNTDTSGYHETITQASIRCARWWLRRGEGAPLSDVLSALLKSPYGRSDWLLAHWARETLFTTRARHAWVEPDLQPLPF